MKKQTVKQQILLLITLTTWKVCNTWTKVMRIVNQEIKGFLF